MVQRILRIATNHKKNIAEIYDFYVIPLEQMYGSKDNDDIANGITDTYIEEIKDFVDETRASATGSNICFFAI